MGLFLQVGEDEPLPVPVQQILAAPGIEDQPGSLLQRFQEEVGLGVVAEGLEVAHPLHSLGDGLLVQDTSGVHLHVYVEPLRDEAFQNLNLNLAHEPGVDLP